MILDYVKHPEAVTVTMMLVAARVQPNRPSLEEATADVLAAYFADWCDEQKADLYALLAEKVQASMTIGQMEQMVSRCLWDNQNEWTRRYG